MKSSNWRSLILENISEKKIEQEINNIVKGIGSIDDIYLFSDQIIETVKRYI